MEDTINITNNKNVNKKDSNLLWIIFFSTIALLLVFALMIWAFFVYWNDPPTHQIIILNNCSEPINVIIGTEQDNILQSLKSSRLLPQSKIYFKVTPAVYLVVQGYFDNTLDMNEKYPYPLTKAKLWLSSQEYYGPSQIIKGKEKLDVNRTSINKFDDIYDISIQNGFNIKIDIKPFDYNYKNINDKFSCSTPSWNDKFECPIELKHSSSNICKSPCNADITNIHFCCNEENACINGCENSWNIYDYYTLFSNICPTCMITNCDLPLYHCENIKDLSKDLTKYLITFS